MTELKPCPYCGGETEYMNLPEYLRTVRCMTPGCINEFGAGRNFRTEEQAREAWNRRDGEASAKAEGAAEERRRIRSAALAWSDNRDMLSLDEVIAIVKGREP